MEVGQYAVHGDGAALRGRGVGRRPRLARLGGRRVLGLGNHQHRVERFGGVTDTIGADVDQRQPLQHGGGLGKGSLGGAQQGQQFVQPGTAAARADLELGIQRMLALSTGGTEVVGAVDGDGAEEGGHLGGALPLKGGGLATGTQDGAGGLGWSEEARQPGDHGGADLLDAAEHGRFDLLEVARRRLHPAAARAGEGGHARAWS